MSVIPVDPEQLSKFIDKSKIFDTTRQLMIGYLTNWYNDDAETFVENMWADLSTVLEHYQFRNEFVSITKNFNFDPPMDTVSCTICITDEEHESLGRGKLLISLQFDKSVCNNQISLLLQNVFVWLLMRSGAFFARSHQPNKAVVDFNVLVSLTVYDGSFSNFRSCIHKRLSKVWK